MEYNCNNCIHPCKTDIQCVDYEFGTKEQIKKRAEEIKRISDGVVDISEYDASDAVTRELYKNMKKKFGD